MGTTFYTKTEDGEFVEANDQVEDLFREKSGKIVAAKLAKERENAAAQLRTEIEADIRATATDSIKSEVRAEIEAEYKAKLETSEKTNAQLNNALLRKTIAAEYGFKPETEQFLGDGSEDEMRAKADILKANFGGQKVELVEKGDAGSVSKTQQQTGIRIEI